MDLNQFRSILGWSVIINFGFLIIVGILFASANEWIYDIWSLFFAIPFDAFDILMIGFLGMWKILVIVFFLVPYWAIVKIQKKG